MDVPVELSRIVITETSPQQVIFLKERQGERSFPIVIGITEALAIDRRLKGFETPRPMTHELLARVIAAMGGQLARIVVSDLREGTFYATIFIEQDGRTIEVDSRPSDAIALGVAFDTPLFVAEHIFEEVLKDSLDLASQREPLQHRRAELMAMIVEIRRRLESPQFKAAAGDNDVLTLRQHLGEMQAELDAIEEILRHLG